ncbi:hypothetical protein LMG19083_04663 [Ralstonia psammae]|uniref:Type III effector protein n=1 Tax=Ralstonia psammae TaxID=3058598 RepID=A0ABM9JZ24_9RALS|nr:hypothetical protein LMG19083_04663 [Ralstonia sp. LMG 19083]
MAHNDTNDHPHIKPQLPNKQGPQLRTAPEARPNALPATGNANVRPIVRFSEGISYPEFVALYERAPMAVAPAAARVDWGAPPNGRRLPHANQAQRATEQAYGTGSRRAVPQQTGPRLAPTRAQEAGRIAQRVGLPMSDQALAHHPNLTRLIPPSHPNIGRRYQQLLTAQEAARGVFAAVKPIEESLGSTRAMRYYWNLPSEAEAAARRGKLALDMAYALEEQGVPPSDLPQVARAAMQRGHRVDRLTAIADGATNAAIAFGLPAIPTAAMGAVGLAGGPMVSVPVVAAMAAVMAPVTAALNVAVPHAIATGRAEAAKQGKVVPATTARVPRWGPKVEQRVVDPIAYQAFIPGQAIVQAGPFISKCVLGTAATAGATIASACAAPISPIVSAVGGGAYSAIKEKYCSERVWTGAVNRAEDGTLKLDTSRYQDLVGELGKTPVHAMLGRRVAAGMGEIVHHPVRHIRQAVKEQPTQVARNLGALLVGDAAGAACAIPMAYETSPHARILAPQVNQGVGQAVMLAGWGRGRQRAPVAPTPVSHRVEESARPGAPPAPPTTTTAAALPIRWPALVLDARYPATGPRMGAAVCG